MDSMQGRGCASNCMRVHGKKLPFLPSFSPLRLRHAWKRMFIELHGSAWKEIALPAFIFFPSFLSLPPNFCVSMQEKSESSSKHYAYSRKQKSLDFLCSNFVSLCKEDADTVCLDDAAMKLGVKRRGSSCPFDLRLAAIAACTLPPPMSIVEVIYRNQYSLIEYPSCCRSSLIAHGIAAHHRRLLSRCLQVKDICEARTTQVSVMEYYF